MPYNPLRIAAASLPLRYRKPMTSQLCIVHLALCIMHCAFSADASAQTLTPDRLSSIEATFKAEGETRALQNIITRNDITGLNHVRGTEASAQNTFTYEVPSHDITDQKSSGRCWLFTGLNVLRKDVIKKQGYRQFQFSQLYLSFYDLLEKCNMFLTKMDTMKGCKDDDQLLHHLLKNPLGEGGTFTGTLDLVEKYGLVPQQAMAETYQSNSSRQMLSILSTRLRKAAMQMRHDKKGDYITPALKDCYRVLALCLGTPPKTFTWQGKEYTPKQFRDEMAPHYKDLADYVMLANDPARPYYKMYDVDMARHTWEGHDWCHLNLPWDDMAAAAIKSLQDSTAMYFSCDVNKYLDRTTGRLDTAQFDTEGLFGISLWMDKADRIISYASASSHAMTLTGVNMEADRPKHWKIENSWGASSGANGFLVATDEWMSAYAFRLVVHKKYLTPEQQKMATQKPIQLPAWDYLW